MGAKPRRSIAYYRAGVLLEAYWRVRAGFSGIAYRLARLSLPRAAVTMGAVLAFYLI
ncbi:hypothetical protein [Pelagibacterium montanilacus]|uniref:hypothetical protein n=1 Tax=Pelagibacterium montanilacus TaxID=2185280 RepID=UPI0013DFE089|nr:hypothetical protein [Pelagibacterium montanilacus]